MDDEQRRAELRQRLLDAADAHFKFETEELGGVRDEQWSDWYAQYMLGVGWNTLFTRQWMQPELAEALRQVDDEHRTRAPQDKWYEYYADYFAKT